MITENLHIENKVFKINRLDKYPLLPQQLCDLKLYKIKKTAALTAAIVKAYQGTR